MWRHVGLGVGREQGTLIQRRDGAREARLGRLSKWLTHLL